MGRPALAGRPLYGDHGWVDQADVLRQLELTDATSSPRLGGMARSHGVVIVSQRYWAYAGVDGSLREGTMPQPPRALRAVPFARGLVRLAASLSPLFRRRGVARGRERLFLLVAIFAPLALVFAPHWVGLAVGAVITFALLGWLLRGRTLYLHGAEHRAIAAAEERRLVDTWSGVARPSRFSLRCGTNFAALLMPVAVFGGRLWPLPATAFTPVFWVSVRRDARRLARVVLLPGLGLQRITTREPELHETRVALTAVASVLRRESAHG